MYHKNICRYRAIPATVALALFSVSIQPTAARAANQGDKITWSTETVEISLPPGARTGWNLTFESERPLADVVLWPVPGLASLMHVEPGVFPDVPANQPQIVRLEFEVPEDAIVGHEYNGIVHLKSGNRTMPRPLKVLVRVIEDDERPGPSLLLVARATPSCATASHVVNVGWNVTDAPGPISVDINLVPSSGPKQSVQYPAAVGQLDFDLSLPSGGHALVLVKADTPDGTAYKAAAVNLLPCFTIVPPAPGAGFGDGDLTVPPGSGVGELREVDIAHLGGSPQGPIQPVVVMSIGSGSAYELSSWRLDGALQPQRIGTAEHVSGRNVKLHVLTDDVTPGLTVDMVVSAAVHNGSLWLTTWRVEPDGSFERLNTRGFGANAAFVVQDFAIAHRPLKSDGGALQRFHVVTPVLGLASDAGPDPVLRTVTWSVNSATGIISGLYDSGSWGEPDADTDLAAVWQSGSTFVVAHRSEGDLALDHWTVTTALGQPIHIGSGVSGLTIRGDDTEEFNAVEFAMSGLTSEGIITAVRQQGTSPPQMLSWETRVVACDAACYLRSYLIGDSADDEIPGGGVSVGPPPSLSDPPPNGAAVTARGLLTDALWEQFGVGAGQVMSVFPANPQFVSTGIASVAKNMTLLVTLAAIDNGFKSLDDVVTISRNAAGTGGSFMGPAPGLEEGERQSLRTLLHAMMIRSCNRASVAIAEHVGLTEEFFVSLMNHTVSMIGLPDTWYTNAWGGGFSTPQDQVTLWLHAYQEPLFRQIANAEGYNACGEIGEGVRRREKCWSITKADFFYPGREGWKGGTTGSFDPDRRDVPLCRPGQCLITQATRMTRSLAAALQFSTNRNEDARAMWDYGFRRLFTPDFRGQADGLVVRDFGVARVTEGASVTGMLDDGGVPHVCTWSHNVDFGQIEPVRCASISSFIGLPPGPPPRSVNGVEVVWLSSLLHEGDYLTAHVNAVSRLQFMLWRAGPREPF